MGKTECIPITKSSEEKQCSEFGRSESNYERFHGSSEDDSDEEYFHKSPALALSLYDCVLYKHFDAMFFRAGHVTCSNHTTLDGGALRHAPLRLLDLESLYGPTIYVLEQIQEKWVYPCIPQFCYIKVGYKGVYITRTCFSDGDSLINYGN